MEGGKGERGKGEGGAPGRSLYLNRKSIRGDLSSSSSLSWSRVSIVLPNDFSTEKGEGGRRPRYSNGTLEPNI